MRLNLSRVVKLSRRSVLWSLGLFALLACHNEQRQFCLEASEKLCRQCQACGPEGLQYCGLVRAKDQASCEQMLQLVCEAQDGFYNRELGRSCLERIKRMHCEQLPSAGKPDVCNRLL